MKPVRLQVPCEQLHSRMEGSHRVKKETTPSCEDTIPEKKQSYSYQIIDMKAPKRSNDDTFLFSRTVPRPTDDV